MSLAAVRLVVSVLVASVLGAFWWAAPLRSEAATATATATATVLDVDDGPAFHRAPPRRSTVERSAAARAPSKSKQRVAAAHRALVLGGSNTKIAPPSLEHASCTNEPATLRGAKALADVVARGPPTRIA